MARARNRTPETDKGVSAQEESADDLEEGTQSEGSAPMQSEPAELEFTEEQPETSIGTAETARPPSEDVPAEELMGEGDFGGGATPPTAAPYDPFGGLPPSLSGGFFSVAEEQTSDTASAGPKKREKKPAEKKGVTPAKRARAAIIGGALLTQLMDRGAAFIGSPARVETFTQGLVGNLTALAERAGVQLPPGIPLDFDGELDIPVIQELSVVLQFKGGKMVPVRFAPGRAALEEGETVAADSQNPKEGEVIIVVLPADIAHAIAYNLASTPTKLLENIVAWLEAHEEAIRTAYAGALLGVFMLHAHRTKS